MAAKYYIYRNLHKGEFFSIKYRGVVVDRQESLIAHNVKLQVSAAGNKRAKQKQQRNVHAYVVADEYTVIEKGVLLKTPVYEVIYKPMQHDAFQWKETGESVEFLKLAWFRDGKLFGTGL